MESFPPNFNFYASIIVIFQTLIHRVLIAICVILGCWLWDRKSLFSFSLKRVLSIFFILFSLNQLKNAILLGKKKFSSNPNFLEYFVLPYFPSDVERSSYVMGAVIALTIVLMMWIAICLVVGLSLVQPKKPLASFSWKRIFSIVFFIYSLTSLYFVFFP